VCPDWHHPSPEEKRGRSGKAPSSSEEGGGGGGTSRKSMLQRAAHMRHNSTEPERRLWQKLRASHLKGYKFRRQAPIGRRIADFFCPAKGLIVELDGDTHDRARDLARDGDMAARFGYRTVRFTNEDVMRNMEGVLLALTEALEMQPDRWPSASKHHPPTPSSKEEGEQ